MKPNNKEFSEANSYFLYNVFRTLTLANASGVYKNISSKKIEIQNFTIFYRKSKLSRFTTLRAPYRYKMGRYQIGFKRLLITSSFSILIPTETTSIFAVPNILRLILLNLKNLGSNVVSLNKIRLSIPISDKNFFNISNYKIKN